MSDYDRNPIDDNDIGKYYEGTDTLVFIYRKLLTADEPSIPTYSMTLQAAATGAISIPLVTPTLEPLSKKQRFIAGNACYALRSDVPAGATSLPVAPLKSAIAANTVSIYVPCVPYYSVEESGFTSDNTTISFRNYGADATDIQKRTRQSNSFSAMGFVTKDDPGLDLLDLCETTPGTWTWVQWIPPTGKARSLFLDLKGGDDKTKTDDPYKRNFNLVGAGKMERTNLALR